MGNQIPMLTVPDDDDLGPAMRICSVPQREFIVALFQTGCKNYSDAAFLTGRYKSRDVAQAASSRWMSNPKVLAALDEYTRMTMKMGLPLAHRALMELVVGADSDAVRFKAAVELFNRNGHLVETVSRHIIEDTRDTKEIVKIAIDYARSLGDPALAYKLLGNSVPKNIIDAEFVEVRDDGTNGLEDLL